MLSVRLILKFLSCHCSYSLNEVDQLFKSLKNYNHIQYFLTPLSDTHPAHEISTLVLPQAPISAFVISGQFHPIFHPTILTLCTPLYSL